ncbi:hypothetical protein [Massilia phyllosphaerae]|uniref:hypothetical protein n=1 Tax=Massilia phyllosphaerae TaxID=3106034 RepID=UPI002B1CAA76|nr:hypothetical protein [Massilia sp. SGZ-792]
MARRFAKDGERRRIAVEHAPHTLVGDVTMVVLCAGIGGARLFHVLENGDLFWRDPLVLISSRSGPSVFGGL